MMMSWRMSLTTMMRLRFVSPRSYLPSAHPPLRLPTLSFLLPPSPHSRLSWIESPDVFRGRDSISASGTEGLSFGIQASGSLLWFDSVWFGIFSWCW
jgi:hypothetical protein